MKTSFLARVLAASLLVAIAPMTLAAPAKPVYHLAASWKLSGDSFWDYLTVDSKAHRLYIPRDTRIQVLDTRTGALVGEVRGLQRAHGVALVPELGRGFASSGAGNCVVVFDLKTLAPVGKPIPVGQGPDAIIYEPATKQILAMNGDGHNISVIDAAGQKVRATIPLSSNPESAAVDGRGTVWVNLEDSSSLAQVDARTRRLVHVFPLAPGKGPTGLAYDAQTARLFAGCANKQLIVLDARSGKRVASVPIGAGVDAGAFDPALGLSFSPNGRDGTLSIVNGRSAKPALLNTVPTRGGARTMALDPQTHALFLVSADYKPLRAGERFPRIIPGSVRVLKLEPGYAR